MNVWRINPRMKKNEGAKKKKKRYRLDYLEEKRCIGGMKTELTYYLDLEDGLRTQAHT